MRIGIFGGTFDPPHIGHMILASEARFQLSIDQLLWVVTLTPPHKLGRKITPLQVRLKLVEAALENSSEFSISRVEIDRPGPHYAVDTVKLLKHQYPGDQLIYVMGGDSLRDLPTWHLPGEFVHEINEIGVMQRPRDRHDLNELEKIAPGISKKVSFLDTPQVEISSSDIRDRIQKGKPFRFFLLPQVYNLILQEKYYL